MTNVAMGPGFLSAPLETRVNLSVEDRGQGGCSRRS